MVLESIETTDTVTLTKESKEKEIDRSFDFWKMENIEKMEEYSVFMTNSWMETDAIGGDSSWGGD